MDVGKEAQGEEKLEIRLEEEWEAADIIEHCNANGIACHVLAQSDLEDLETHDFLSMPFFCATEVVQHHLKAAELAEKVVPDTYSQNYAPLFGRKIQRISFTDLKGLAQTDFPLFFKPASNNKLFDGCVVTDQAHIDEVLEMHDVDKDVAATMEVYVCEVVKFACEKRLFVGAGKIYATGHQFGKDDTPLDSAFVDQVAKLSDGKYCAVDIGYLPASSQWVVVEVNPPFALDDWGIATATYLQHGINFWRTEIAPSLKRM